jgi:hypothetical protein
MRFFRPAMAAFVIGVSAPLTLVAPGFAQTCECPPADLSSGPVIESDEPPPPLPDYDQPPMPAPGYYWTPGYWAWNNDDYYWVPGVWVEPPQPELLWTPGYWAFINGVYRFHRGYWGPRVGFYGGINYGYGYGGAGYDGGRWDNGHFFYNRSVNNFGALRVANVYDRPIPPPVVMTAASFNGGGGTVAKPTPEELRAATERHVPPTALQRSQVRAASLRPDQFLTTNQGKPAIAATPRPGDFKGKGVIPAKAAGSAQTTPATAPNGQPPTPMGEPKLPVGEKPIKAEPLNAPKALEKLPGAPAQPVAPGQPPNGATKLQEKLPAGEKPIKAEPLNVPKAEEKPPGGPTPPTIAKPPAPLKPELTPNHAPADLQRQQELQREQELQRQQGLQHQQEQQLQLQQQQKAQQQQQLLRQQEQQRAIQRPVAPQPGGKPPVCGKPGLPECPK